MIRIIALLTFLSTTPLSYSDWAAVPDLRSRHLWQLVADGDADVVSSVGFSDEDGFHYKNTIFKITNIKSTDAHWRWVSNRNGKFSPVMCKEIWENRFIYRGSSCSVTGSEPTN
jgi:hypothetical protein